MAWQRITGRRGPQTKTVEQDLEEIKRIGRAKKPHKPLTDDDCFDLITDIADTSEEAAAELAILCEVAGDDHRRVLDAYLGGDPKIGH